MSNSSATRDSTPPASTPPLPITHLKEVYARTHPAAEIEIETEDQEC
jgi:hypothetical protein